jgi:hypothetical protein
MEWLRMDGDGANVTPSVEKMLDKLHIKLQLSFPYSPQLLGKVERLIWVTKSSGRILLIAADLQHGNGRGLALAAIRHAAMHYNLTPKEALNWQTPASRLPLHTDPALILNLPW